MTKLSTKNRPPFKPVVLENEDGVPPEEMKRFQDIFNKHLKEAYDNPQSGDDDEVTDLPEYVPITGDSVQAVFVSKTPKTPKKKK